MEGKHVIFKPGWDCHGLPIELAVQRKLKVSDPIQLRNECKRAAVETAEKQRNEFMSWGVLADWKNTYKTVDPTYEMTELEVFSKLLQDGRIFRELKPVYWSPTSHTAIAESELEYNSSHQSLSTTVGFKLTSGDGFLIVWTTTPWSLPSNEAVAFNEELQYAWYTDNKNKYLLATCTADRISSTIGVSLQEMEKVPIQAIASMHYLHPFEPEK